MIEQFEYERKSACRTGVERMPERMARRNGCSSLGSCGWTDDRESIRSINNRIECSKVRRRTS